MMIDNNPPPIEPKTEEIKVRITPSLRRDIDEVRGDESVSSLVRAALRRYFDELRTRRAGNE